MRHGPQQIQLVPWWYKGYKKKASFSQGVRLLACS